MTRVLGDPLARTLGGLGLGQGAGGLNPTMEYLIRSTDPSNLIAYWPLGETAGTVADDPVGGFDGAYAGTVTLGEQGIGDGSLSALFGGGRVSLASVVAALDTPFDPTLGSMVCSARVIDSSIWSDVGSNTICSFGADINNRSVLTARFSGANTATGFYRGGGTHDEVSKSTSTLNWFLFALTWNISADRIRVYFNRSLTGSAGTLGTWVGALAATFTAIGDLTSSGGANNWLGWLAHCALWKSELQLADIQRLAPAIYFPD